MPRLHQKLIARATSAFMGRYTKYYLNVNEKASGGLPPPPEQKKYLLYVHVPFCSTFCTYCTFNKFAYTKERASNYFKYLRDEMRHVKSLGYDFDYLVIGGGTPLIDEAELIETIDLAKSLFSIENVTCETDPNNIQPEVVQKLVGRVNRLSIGVQTFDDTLLKKIGRFQKFGSGEAIFEKIKAILGILPIVSVDLIFNFPEQTQEGLLNDIAIVKKLSPEQTTFYPLMTSPMIKDSVKRSLGEFSLENEHLYFKIITKHLGEAYPSIKGWSFSKADGVMIDEYVIDNEEYVGIGSGSFSFLKDTLYSNEFALDPYASLIKTQHSAVIKKRAFPQKSMMYYRLMVDLFNGTLSKKRFERIFGQPIKKALWMELLLLKCIGAIREDHGHIHTTEFGSYLFLMLMKEFYMGMDHIRESERAKIKDLDLLREP